MTKAKTKAQRIASAINSMVVGTRLQSEAADSYIRALWRAHVVQAEITLIELGIPVVGHESLADAKAALASIDRVLDNLRAERNASDTRCPRAAHVKSEDTGRFLCYQHGAALERYEASPDGYGERCQHSRSID